MGKQSAEDLRQSFRTSRGQDQIAQSDVSAPRSNKKPVEKSVDNVDNSKSFRNNVGKPPKDDYQAFLEKYHNIELRIDDFTPKDLMYYFKEVSRKNNFKYVIANMSRDIGIMKRALKDRSPREICAMIEFIFESGQLYIDRAKVQPTVLSHSVSNKIYADMLLWCDDLYVPEMTNDRAKAKSVTVLKQREYKKVPNGVTSIDRIDKKG